ncbi:hypothetical protein JHK86_024402 [Glycine max]|nr:hypothetical protein JHK86_024402 [Glycine max]
MKRNIGFVSQDDVLYPHLTVLESLTYAVMLKLPKSLTREEKMEQVEMIIVDLGLSRCRNSPVGGGAALFQGISGGERKRVSIGQEMLVNPSLLLLDEPTYGLDSTMAQRIMAMLQSLARAYRTVVTTIDQPSSRLYWMFDKVVMLSDGYPIFTGQTDQVMDYLESVGFVPVFNFVNPTDFLLDLANGSENQWTTSWWEQFMVLLKRGLTERRHESYLGLRIFQVLSVSILSGLLWWHSDPSHIHDQACYSSSPSSGVLPSLQCRLRFSIGTTNADERKIIRHLPSLLLLCSQDGRGLTNGICASHHLCSHLLLDGWTQAIATTLASVTMLVFLLAGGYYIRHIPFFIAWLKYISFSHYCYKLLVGVQYSVNEVYQCRHGLHCRIRDFLAIKCLRLDSLWGDVAVLAVNIGSLLNPDSLTFAQ